MSTVEDFLTQDQENAIIDAIREAEVKTTGEIRVHIEHSSDLPAFERAKVLFHVLKMDNTKESNGVLFYIAIQSRSFAICGDKGINNKVPDNFWNEIKSILTSYFTKQEYALGLVEGIGLTGIALQKHFPWIPGDKNELTNEISKG